MQDEAPADFAVVAYREDGRWEAAPLPPRVSEDLDALLHALRQQPSEGGTIGLVSVGDDFFLAVRMMGTDVRMLLSDMGAATDWPLGRAVLEKLEVPLPEGDDLDRVQPAGDLALFADLGLDEMSLSALAGDLELYPDEMLSSVAARLGFGEQFDRAVDTSLG